MNNRNLVWAVAILAAILVVLPLVSMSGMMGIGGSCCAGMMSGNFAAMTFVGWVWMLAGAVLLITIIVLLARLLTRT